MNHSKHVNHPTNQMSKLNTHRPGNFKRFIFSQKKQKKRIEEKECLNTRPGHKDHHSIRSVLKMRCEESICKICIWSKCGHLITPRFFHVIAPQDGRSMRMLNEHFLESYNRKCTDCMRPAVQK